MEDSNHYSNAYLYIKTIIQALQLRDKTQQLESAMIRRWAEGGESKDRISRFFMERVETDAEENDPREKVSADGKTIFVDEFEFVLEKPYWEFTAEDLENFSIQRG